VVVVVSAAPSFKTSELTSAEMPPFLTLSTPGKTFKRCVRFPESHSNLSSSSTLRTTRWITSFEGGKRPAYTTRRAVS